MPKLIGQPLPRREDRRFVTGAGRYTADVRAAGAAHAAFVRSPHAHARIIDLRTGAAAGAPGVLAVLTGEQYLADGHAGIPHVANAADALDPTQPAFVAPPGARPVPEETQLPLAVDRVRYVGEPVAVVVAETAALARDAAELVDVAYEPLSAVVTAEDALAPNAPQIRDDVPGNLCFDLTYGDAEPAQRIFDGAWLVVERTFHHQRLCSAQMEPRAAIGSYDAARGRWTLIGGSQGAVRWRTAVAQALGVPAADVEVVCPDVGGGFGSRSHLHPEPLVVLWAARRTGRAVRWNGDRSEGFLTDFQGRDIGVRAAIAFDERGTILATRFLVTGNCGAHPVSYAPLSNYRRIGTTLYDVPVSVMRIRAVLTNTTPVVPYRGAGRPEATSTIERLLDLAAEPLGIDRVELRRRNLIRRTQLPYRTPGGLVYDAGDFAGNMERALALADWGGFTERRDASERRGRLRGIGVANYVESPVGLPRERVVVRVFPERSVEIVAGTQSSGQGHETTFAQVAGELLGVPFASVSVLEGDTRIVASGGGSHSNRSMRIVGTLLVDACAQILAQARGALAARCDVDAGTIAFNEGAFTLPDGTTHDLFTLAAIVELRAVAEIAHRIPAFPTGAAVCEVEIDPRTGAVAVARYTQVDDAGQPINPLILHGQAHGGIAQGLGQALSETVAIDRVSGQVLGGSFMDYAVPRAAQLPPLQVVLTEDPTAGNPLRVKGGGEGGITPSPVATVNAIVDALRRFGVDDVATPATPERVWRAIRRGTAPR